MKKYILSVFGTFEKEKDCQDLAIALTPIVDSKHLKFQHSKGVTLFHFASEVSKVEIYDYVVGILYGITETFILTEINDNMTLHLPNNVISHLMDLENDSEDAEMKIDMNRIKKNLDFMEEEDDDDFVALLLGEKNNLFKKPSLDEILDKILDKGYDTLTEYEKEILKSFS